MSEIKNILDEVNNTLDTAEKQMSEFKNTALETIKMKHGGWGQKTKKQSISELQDNFKPPNTHVIEVPKRKGME